MLSKVLSRADAGAIQMLVFPQLNGYYSGASAGSPVQSWTGGTDETSALLDKLRNLESRLATERREAFEAGRLEGEKHSRAELQPVLARLHNSANEVLALRPDLRRSAERDVVQLALLIAKRVLHRQLAVDEGALTAIARVAFERLTRSESYRVTVHPQFASAITAALPATHAARVQIDSDPGCALGTLVIHSSEGIIDASVDAQLEEISRGLTDRLATP
jgi:flagellar assembly protein FliH